MKLILIDADVLTYRIGFTTEDKPVEIAYWRLDETIDRIRDQLETNAYRCYLTSTDKSNFRFQIYPEYKANRKQPKPTHYDAIRDYIQEKHGGIVVRGIEADDGLGIDYNESEADITGKILCTIDKDLDQIPGWHFNFVTNRLYNISEAEGWRCFYGQLLEGDRTDNIAGCPGIGKVKARRLLEGCQDENEMFEAAGKQYLLAYNDLQAATEKLLLNAHLLWIQRKAGDKWNRNSNPVSKENLQMDLEKLKLQLSMKAIK